MPSKQAQYKAEAAKQLRRIQRFMARKEAEGYVFGVSLPKTPKRPTAKTVERLKKITPNYLYSKAQYMDPETLDVMSGTEARAREAAKRKERKAKKEEAKIASLERRASWTDSVLGGFLEEWGLPDTNPDHPGAQILQSFYDNLVKERGRDIAAEILETRASLDGDAHWRILYDDGGDAGEYVAEMRMLIANNAPPQMIQDLTDVANVAEGIGL